MPRTEDRPISAQRQTGAGPGQGTWSEARGAAQHQHGAFKKSLHRVAVGAMRIMPKPLVRLAADPYIAGETREEALQLCDRLWERQGLSSTCDVLGESIETEAQAQDYFREFAALIPELGTRQEYTNASLKLSGLGQELDEERCYQRTRELVELARDHGQFVRLDMEDHTTTDSTLRIYRRLREKGLENCGVVLQSRLFRTRTDIQELAPLRPNVRLCIGIYREPPSIALQDKTEMKKHMLELLEVLWRNQQHVGLATHEEWAIREALSLARRLDKPLEEVEVQMLLGVPRSSLQRELLEMGVRVRLYVPYGEHWHAYSMRRLENNPDMMSMVAANVLTRPFRRD